VVIVAPNDRGLGAVEVWFQDEARVGQRGTVTRIWAAKGSRPRVIQQQVRGGLCVWGGMPCPGHSRRIGHAQSE
jgi:hypothetical protein